MASLLDYAALKALAERLLLEGIEQRQGTVTVRFHPQTPVRPERLVEFVRRTPQARLDPGGGLCFPVERAAPDWVARLRKQLLELEG